MRSRCCSVAWDGVRRVNPIADLPVALSFGMGLDSASILARWLVEPETRDFPLDRLTVVTAMTGDEPDITRRLMEQHLLPLMRAAEVRFVQISRAAQAGGYVVLDDSREPQRMIMRGPWRLSDELKTSGTVPQVAAKRRLCSWRAKGSVLDAWYADEYQGHPFRHVIGFAAEEVRRAVRDQSYTTACRQPEYPLINDWGWDREQCDRFLYSLFNQRWSRSACGYCPFAGSRAGLPELVERWRAEPEIGADALALEYTALALNPRSRLFGSRSAQDVVRLHGLCEVQRRFEYRLERPEQMWSLYDVRRIVHPRRDDPTRKGATWRSVRIGYTGARGDVEEAARWHAHKAGASASADGYGITRAEIVPRGPSFPALERTLAVAPAGALAKQRTAFESWWERLVHEQRQPDSTRHHLYLAA